MALIFFLQMVPHPGMVPLSSGSAQPAAAAVGMATSSGKIPRAKPIMPKQAVYRHGVTATLQNYLVCGEQC